MSSRVRTELAAVDRDNGPCMLSMYPGDSDLRGVLWLILTGIGSRIAQKYTSPLPSSVWGMLGHKWHILARS